MTMTPEQQNIVGEAMNLLMAQFVNRVGGPSIATAR